MSSAPAPAHWRNRAIHTSLDLAKICAQIADGKKAEDILVLDVRTSPLTDYFVFCSGSNPKQLQAIAYEIEMRLKATGRRYYGREGYEVGRWVLMDYSDVVVHILHQDQRKHYDLERNWADAPRVEWKEEPLRKAVGE